MIDLASFALRYTSTSEAASNNFTIKDSLHVACKESLIVIRFYYLCHIVKLRKLKIQKSDYVSTPVISRYPRSSVMEIPSPASKIFELISMAPERTCIHTFRLGGKS